MSIEDLKIRLHKRGGPICEEAVLRIEALENSVKFDMDLFITQKARIAELERELALTELNSYAYQRVLKAIPACPIHGNNCIPHALEWVAEAGKDAERYRFLRHEKELIPMSWKLDIPSGEQLDSSIDLMIDAIKESQHGK